MRELTNFLPLFLMFTVFCSKDCIAVDTLTITEPIHDPQSIVSSSKTYRLGFFTPANTSYRYVGIIMNIPELTVIWVANRDRPLRDSAGVVAISDDGNIVVLDGKNETLWSSNVSKPAANSSAQLLDTGNLVLRDNSDGRLIWESFQIPTDSFVQTMKLVVTLKYKSLFTSWRSPSDPSIGNFSLGFGPHRIPETFVWNNGKPYWRSGPWNGTVFIGIPGMYTAYINGLHMDENTEPKYLVLDKLHDSVDVYYVLTSSGTFDEMFYYDGMVGNPVVMWSSIDSECDFYGKCGPFGLCNPLNLPICSCLQDFEPRDKEQWDRGNWTGGCLRKAELQCEIYGSAVQDGKQDIFQKLSNVKVPDFSYVVDITRSDTEQSCGNQCWNNCTCIAYAFRRGIGCMQWSSGLLDMQKFTFDGSDLYVRVAYSVLDHSNSKWGKNGVISSIVIGISLFIIGFIYFVCKRITKSREGFSKLKTVLAENEELHLYSYDTLANATNNFHSRNMIGKGGFGPVYKGKLTNGQEIAVKTLSNSSTQGNEEFMNEVMVISKLQHRNLVRLLGCCAEQEEKLLVYEYMPNKSLDAYIFDSIGQDFLDWKRRQVIIEGISRGLLYLHRDSRLKIIHRDLKTSNILLDAEFNPKISDFGLAKIFGGSEDQANTNRVVGTYGYMAPEYAMQGKFSEKSDIYSFGVLLLEILSGTRNVSFCSAQNDLSLIGHAWELWQNKETAKFFDLRILDELSESEISKYIHIGLLCVQEYATDRPTMSAVLLMLHSQITELPRPKLPAYAGTLLCSSENKPCQQSEQSANDVTITTLLGR